MKTEIIENKYTAMNVLNKWLNKVSPLLQAYFVSGQYKLLTDGSLSKKSKLEVNEIIKDKPFRAYIDTGCNSVKLCADVTYKNNPDYNGYQSNSFYKHTVFLITLVQNQYSDREKHNTPCPLGLYKTNYSKKYFDSNLKKLEVLKAKISELESKKRVIEFNLDL